jgi:hypothetical protein
MLFALEDTNTDQKKQFWFLRCHPELGTGVHALDSCLTYTCSRAL